MILKIIFFLLFSFYHAEANDNNELIFHNSPKKLEVLNLKKLDGTSVNIKKISNNYLIINFWATWCPPCISELPALDKMALQLKKYKIKVLAISMDRGETKKLSTYLKNKGGKNLIFAQDKGWESGRLLSIKGLPETLILKINGKGKFEIVSRHSGALEWDQNEIINKVKKLIF